MYTKRSPRECLDDVSIGPTLTRVPSNLASIATLAAQSSGIALPSLSQNLIRDCGLFPRRPPVSCSRAERPVTRTAVDHPARSRVTRRTSLWHGGSDGMTSLQWG